MKIFLSSLGMMGRRHLAGAVLAGVEIVAFDPSAESIEKAKETVQKNGGDPNKVTYLTEFPKGMKFDAAIFSETADYRKDNFERFVETNTASKILLEKPVVRSAGDLAMVAQKAKQLQSSGVKVEVNFPRRVWPFYMAIKEQLKGDQVLEMTLNGGAVGLGCNGIHYIDLFAFLSSGFGGKLNAAYSKVSKDMVNSGRGARFKDYGGQFLLQRGPATFYLSMNPLSTTTPVLSIKTTHSVLWIDENNYTYRQWNKTAGFEKPNYLYGQDYAVKGEGPVAYRDLIPLTKDWLQGNVELPKLEDVVESHTALFDLLSSGGAEEPYLFT